MLTLFEKFRLESLDIGQGSLDIRCFLFVASSNSPIFVVPMSNVSAASALCQQSLP